MADNINTAILDRAVDRAAVNRLYEANMLDSINITSNNTLASGT